jgi:hypothetical protein
MVSSARLSIVAAACFSIYAFASVPIWNSGPTIVGPIARIVVFSSWIGAARTLARAQESFSLRPGLIGGALPLVLGFSAIIYLSLSGPRSAPEQFLEVAMSVAVGFCSIGAYSFICGMFAAVPKSVVGALFVSGILFVVQVGVDLLFVSVGAYGPPPKVHF